MRIISASRFLSASRFIENFSAGVCQEWPTFVIATCLAALGYLAAPSTFILFSGSATALLLLTSAALWLLFEVRRCERIRAFRAQARLHGASLPPAPAPTKPKHGFAWWAWRVLAVGFLMLTLSVYAHAMESPARSGADTHDPAVRPSLLNACTEPGPGNTLTVNLRAQHPTADGDGPSRISLQLPDASHPDTELPPFVLNLPPCPPSKAYQP